MLSKFLTHKNVIYFVISIFKVILTIILEVIVSILKYAKH